MKKHTKQIHKYRQTYTHTNTGTYKHTQRVFIHLDYNTSMLLNSVSKSVSNICLALLVSPFSFPLLSLPIPFAELSLFVLY